MHNRENRGEILQICIHKANFSMPPCASLLETLPHEEIGRAQCRILWVAADRQAQQDSCTEIHQLYYTVVSGRKAIVGLRHPVTIPIHMSTEISKNSHPKDIKV